MRDERWNLTLDFTQEDGVNGLYDLQADPEERVDVRSAHPEVVQECIGFLEETHGPLPYEIKHRGDRRQAPPLSVRIRPGE